MYLWSYFEIKNHFQEKCLKTLLLKDFNQLLILLLIYITSISTVVRGMRHISEKYENMKTLMTIRHK